jgi:ABC-type amino acid transport substrate-binding protein
LVVGLGQQNLPFSAAHPKPAGLDFEIAELLAKKLGVSLKIYWGHPSHDSYPSRLATRKLCDIMLGVMPDDRFGQRVLYSKPYYLAAHRLVTKSGVSLGLADFTKDTLAVEQGAVMRGLPDKTRTKSYPSVSAILEAVAKGDVKAGYVISTRSQWLAEQDWKGKLKFSDGAKADRFPICAVARKGDRDLIAALDLAFASLLESGDLERVFARWHVPYVMPNEERKSK